MSKTVIIPVAEIHTRVAAIQGDLDAIQTTLQEKMSTGGVQAQASRLVAFALAKQAGQLVGVAAMVTEQLGVDEAAVGPFILETTCIVLPMVEQLVNTAKEKLAEADQIIEG